MSTRESTEPRTQACFDAGARLAKRSPIERPMSNLELRVGRRSVGISRPDKLLFPEDGLTKADVAQYYALMAGTMLPYLRDRPLYLRRFPDGITGVGIEQKRVPAYVPSWVKRLRVPQKHGGSLTQVICNDAATLVYLADQAAIELHAWLSRKDRLNLPDQLIFDLDPPGTEFACVRETARLLRDLLERLGLVPFLKSSGGAGLHVLCPIERRTDFDGVREFARSAAELLAARHPDQLTVEQRKQRRRGRVFLDVYRNGYAQTAIAPYAIRARPGAPIAAPLAWHELASYTPGRYVVGNAFERLEKNGDPWRDLRRNARSLHEPRRRLAALWSRKRSLA